MGVKYITTSATRGANNVVVISYEALLRDHDGNKRFNAPVEVKTFVVKIYLYKIRTHVT